MKDAKGREIQVGDEVAVTQRRGSSLWLNFYEVTEVEPTRFCFLSTKTSRSYWSLSSDKVVSLTAAYRAAKSREADTDRDQDAAPDELPSDHR